MNLFKRFELTFFSVKKIFIFTLICVEMACKSSEPKLQEAAQPVSTVVEPAKKSFTPQSTPYLRLSINMDMEEDTVIYCDTKAYEVEKFEQNGVLLERFRLAKEWYIEWLKISPPNQPCKLQSLSREEARWYNFQDWDKDGFKDMLMGLDRKGNYRVVVFNPKTNDFERIEGDGVFMDTWALDSTKGLYLDRSDNSEYRYGSNFEDIFKLYSFQNKQFKPIGNIRFFIDAKEPTKCLVEMERTRDKKILPMDSSVFNELMTQAVAIHAPRVANDKEDGSNAVQAVEDKAQKDHENWVIAAKPIVENYFKENLGMITK